MNRLFASVSTAVFSIAIMCAVALFAYAGLISGWNAALFWALASKTLFLFGIVLPGIGIPLAWHVLRAPTRVEEFIEGTVLLFSWLAALYVIYLASLFIV